MADRTSIQIRFKKAIWKCSNCAQVDYQDLNVSGGDTYEHNCSNCNEWSNKFVRYSGSLVYSPTEFYGDENADPIVLPKTEQEVATDKQALIAKWWYDHENPPPYVEPSVDDHKNVIDSRLEEIVAELRRLESKLTAGELETYKDVLKDTIDG